MSTPEPLERLLDTPHGEARLVTHDVPDRVGAPVADLLLSHGAGGGVEARDLVALAAALPLLGVRVHLLEQPWRRAARRIATPPPTLDAALLVAAAALERDGRPLLLGGRSAGARSACRCAVAAGAVGVLALSFPLHPPGRPERSRADELRGAGVPVLVVQGDRDPMGRPEEFPDDLPGTTLAVLAGGDHGLKVPARGPLTAEAAMRVVTDATATWLQQFGRTHDGTREEK